MSRIAVLVSGEGSNRNAMSTNGIPIALVLADRECKAMYAARESRIPTALVERKDFTRAFDAERDKYTHEVLKCLRKHDIEFVVLAGFKTVLSPFFFYDDAYGNERALNMHNSLLPAFPGNHAVRDALRAGVTETGCTLHVATGEQDFGRILVQGRVQINKKDTLETLTKKIKLVEWLLYPPVIKMHIRNLSYL